MGWEWGEEEEEEERRSSLSFPRGSNRLAGAAEVGGEQSHNSSQNIGLPRARRSCGVPRHTQENRKHVGTPGARQQLRRLWHELAHTQSAAQSEH